MERQFSRVLTKAAQALPAVVLTGRRRADKRPRSYATSFPTAEYRLLEDPDAVAAAYGSSRLPGKGSNESESTALEQEALRKVWGSSPSCSILLWYPNNKYSQGSVVDRTERIYKIKTMLLTGRPIRMDRLLSALEVSKPTVRRDLEYMRDRLNWPIVWDRERRGYRVDESETHRHELPGLWLNSAEAHALLTMHQLLHGLQPSLLAPHIEPLKARIEALLETPEQSASEVMKRIRVLPIGARRVEPTSFQMLAYALLTRRIDVRHFSRERNQESRRELSPQRLVHYRDNWYLDAWDHDLDDLRTFSVEMIRQVDVLDRRARDVSEQVLDEELSSGYGIFAGKEVRTAKLRFTPQRARWVEGEFWHSQQRASSDGEYYVLEVPYSDDRELLMDILRYGPDVEVLAPKALRETVERRLGEAAAQYRAG